MKKHLTTLSFLIITLAAFTQAGNKPIVKIENKDYYLVDVSGTNTMVGLTGGESDAKYNLTCRVMSFYYPVTMDVNPDYGTYGNETKFFCACNKSYFKTVGVGNIIQQVEFNTYFGSVDSNDVFKVDWFPGTERE